jgi:restriction endonuclease S subunit
MMTPIGSLLRPRKEKVDRDEYEFADLQPVTIHFDGSIDRRETEREYTMTLYFARPGDIVVAKIDLKNGAVAIVPDDWENVVVTGHFAVYEPDRSRLVPEYLHRIIQTGFFKKHLWRNKVGAEGRKEVKLDFFESVEIPLPSREEQKAIVVQWEQARSEAENARNAWQAVIDDLNATLYARYRTESTRDVLEERALVVGWKDLDCWDFKTGRAAAFRLATPTFQPMGRLVEEATELVKPWEEPDKEWAVYGVNNKEGVFFSHLQKGRDFNAAYKGIREEWFFHNPTRSSVGSLGIVPDVPEGAVTSPEYQVWRIKQGLVPGYVDVLINTPFFVELIQFHRVGAVKQRLYVSNLMDIRIPVLSEEEQERIAEGRSDALNRIAKAERELERTAAKIEARILGVSGVELEKD